jgi:LPXTG-motif cell wall-anchored protein
VPYVARSNDASLTAELPDSRAEEPTTVLASAGGETETYWLAALGAAVLILIELYLVLRDLRRSRFVSRDVTP